MNTHLEVDIEGTVQTIPILKPVSVIGKKPPCDVVLAHKSVSSQHAKLIVTYNSVTIEDLNSTNGTRVRGERISGPVELKDGDIVQLGAVKVRLTVELDEAAQERPAVPARRSGVSAARQPEILKVLEDGVSIKDRIQLLNREFSSKIFIPGIHWRIRFFLLFAGGMVGTALALGIIYLLATGSRIDPRYLEKLRQFSAENIPPLSGGARGFSAKSLQLMQNPEIIGYYMLDTEGHQLYPRSDSKIPIESSGFNPDSFTGPGVLRGPGGSWYLVEGITVDGNRLGFASLLFDRRPTSRIGAVSTGLIVVVLLFLLVVGYLFITFAGRIITTPIATLIVEVDELRMGQRSELSRYDYFPEVDRLAQALQQILKREK